MGKSKRQSEVKIKQLKCALQSKRAEIRQLRQKIKELKVSRDHQRAKVKIMRAELKKAAPVCRRGFSIPLNREISGHKYDLRVVSLCVCLYAYAGCSFRSVSRILLYLQLEYGIAFSALPSKSSIENWVQKVGLYKYSHVGVDFWEDYCIILDESMVIGQQRMLVALGACANKEGDCSLKFDEIKVLSIAVQASWKWQEVQDFLQKVQEKVGKPARYVICDGGCNLKKGVEEAQLIRICDVGHEFCKLTEQTYKEDRRYQEWIKEVTKVRFQVFMKPYAYLMPPKQRTVARFTNLSFVVEWGLNMLRVLPSMSEKEQEAFGWLKSHATIIAEFGAVFEMNESVLKILKNEGISVKNIESCILICQKYAPKVPNSLIEKIVKYLNDEKLKLPDRSRVWNASSDVLESLFGKYKYQAPANPLNGVTPLVLALCVFTDKKEDQQTLHHQVKEALESISMAKLKTWKEKNLVENQLVRRRNVFQN